MRIQFKFMLLVFLVLVGTVTAVVWKTRSMLVKDKLGFIADSSTKQIAPFKRLVKERLDEQKSKLVQYASSRASVGAARSRLPEGIDAVALVQIGAASQQWTPSWFEKNSSMKADMPAGFEQTLLKSFPYGRVKEVDELWARVSDHQGSPLYALMFSVEIQTAQPGAAPVEGALPDSVDYGANGGAQGASRAVLVALTSSDLLAGATEDFIGSTSTVYLIDDKGYVASHVNKAFLGALFTEDPLVAEIVATKKTAASGNYEDLESRAVLGHFEMIRGTNLYAVITTPLQATQESINAQVWTSLSIAGIFGAVCLLLTYLFVGRAVTEPVNGAIEALRSINRGEAFVVPSANSKDEIGTLLRLLADSSPAALAANSNFGKQAVVAKPGPTKDEQDGGSAQSRIVAIAASVDQLAQERRFAYEAFNEGFSGALKEPLLAILGHAQLAKSKSNEDEVRAHTDSIEREARRAKDVLERLKDWSNTDVASRPELEQMDLQQIVEEVLQSREEGLKAEGIYLSKELHRVPKVRGSIEQMKVAFSSLLDNATEAMKARPKKHLRVQLDFLNDRLYLVVNDTGIGMSRDVKERAFEPFFKGFDSPERIGLGLSVVQSAIAHFGGTCQIESTPGEGATVTLKLPVAIEEKQLFRMSEQLADTAAANASESDVVAAPMAAPSKESELGPLPPPTESALQGLPPAGASVHDENSNPSVLSTLSHGDADEDEDEPFASVSLSKPMRALDDDESEHDEASASKHPDGFHVQIRRPRARS